MKPREPTFDQTRHVGLRGGILPSFQMAAFVAENKLRCDARDSHRPTLVGPIDYNSNPSPTQFREKPKPYLRQSELLYRRVLTDVRASLLIFNLSEGLVDFATRPQDRSHLFSALVRLKIPRRTCEVNRPASNHSSFLILRSSVAFPQLRYACRVKVPS